MILTELAGQSHLVAVLIAALGFLVMATGSFLAFHFLGKPSSTISTQYTELVARQKKVREKLRQARNQSPISGDACAAMCSAQHMIDDMAEGVSGPPGPQWLSGIGYLSAWLQLHDAEESVALFGTQSAARSMACEDIYRLQGSHIEQATNLQTAAKAALDALTPPGYRWSGRRRLLEAHARQEVRRVRSDINAYRDERYQSLVDMRDQLMTVNAMLWAALPVAIVGLLYLDLDAKLIATAALLFLAGAGAGLVSHLMTMSRTNSAAAAVQDFGLSTARGFAVPTISGVVAVLGVIVVAALRITVSGQPLVSSAGPVDWSKVFSAGNGGAIAIAILFGFAPDQFLRLLQNINKTKIELSKSEPSSG